MPLPLWLCCIFGLRPEGLWQRDVNGLGTRDVYIMHYSNPFVTGGQKNSHKGCNIPCTNCCHLDCISSMFWNFCITNQHFCNYLAMIVSIDYSTGKLLPPCAQRACPSHPTHSSRVRCQSSITLPTIVAVLMIQPIPSCPAIMLIYSGPFAPMFESALLGVCNEMNLWAKGCVNMLIHQITFQSHNYDLCGAS